MTFRVLISCDIRPALMKKFLLIAALLLTSNVFAQASGHYKVQAKNLLFVPIDGLGFCNGIKVYNGQTWLFNLGSVNCAVATMVWREDFENDSYAYIESVANLLNAYVAKIEKETWLVVDALYWDEYDPTFFIFKSNR